MKKRILGILLVVLMLLASTVSVFASDTEVHPGDVNLDGKLNLMDCSLILKYVAKWDMTSWTFSEENADVNGDGRINISDVRLILYKVGNMWYPGKAD